MSLTQKVSGNIYDGILEKKYIDGGQRLTNSV
ncbi:MAG: hypothetical protein ACI95X_002497, partial [Paraglaciecola sp.]